MLLNINERVDNTFEYEGEIGRVTEVAFHATLKEQLKSNGITWRKRCKQGSLNRNISAKTTGSI